MRDEPIADGGRGGLPALRVRRLVVVQGGGHPWQRVIGHSRG